jgi:uncharacterized protein YjbI with pentapeptide repeats
LDGKIIYQDEAESFRALILAAIKSRANLYGANLYGYFCFGPGGSRNAYTWALWEDSGYMVHCGCKTLPLKNFASEVKKIHGKNYYAKWYAANIATMNIVAKESKKAWLDVKAKEEFHR